MSGNCPNCNKPLRNAIKCHHCGHLTLRITLQPKQRLIGDLICQVGPTVPTKLGFGGSRGSAKSRCARDINIYRAFIDFCPGCGAPNGRWAKTCCRCGRVVAFDGVLLYIVARNYPNLQDNYVKKYNSERPDVMAHYRGSPAPEINLPRELGGSTIAFRAADTQKDVEKLERGPEAYLVTVEQAEQFSPEELVMLQKPARWPNVPVGTCKTAYFFNPGGIGMPYLQRVFYKQEFTEQEDAHDYRFVQAYGWDNFAWFSDSFPNLSFDDFYALPGDLPPCEDEKYSEEWLSRLPDNHRFKMYVKHTAEGKKYWQMPQSTRLGDLFGSFKQFKGQYFAEVWDERYCVLTRKQISELAENWWTAWMSGDLGYGHYSSFYWFVIGRPKAEKMQRVLGISEPTDIVIVYRELIPEPRTAEADIGRMIVEATPELERAELVKFVMGSDVNRVDRYASHSRKELIEDVTMPADFPSITNSNQAPGSRVISARLCWEMLRRTTVLRSGTGNELPESRSKPLMFISEECPGLISTIPSLVSDEDNPDDVLKTDSRGDDIYDGWKGGVAEYSSAKLMAPRVVRRAEAMGQAQTMHGRYMASLKFDDEEKASTRRGRRVG